ncbi:hypothetical protein ANCDUO_01962 [Ancylostoma duodenale]|uniref:Uncharacterized protein n=1 Tax=Ancylostoma duodenale TaxID=51022 RepID=A0A0C2DCW8_9BILA|nr:hypothetical protein ANCDUO_01962 [Ancylostoma duodenale]
MPNSVRRSRSPTLNSEAVVSIAVVPRIFYSVPNYFLKIEIQIRRSWPIRIKRMIYELYSNVAQMFTTQPLLSSCLFGVPIAFLSIICYSICSADFTVDREEFYPEDEDEDYDDSLEEDERAHLVDPNHAKNE